MQTLFGSPALPDPLEQALEAANVMVDAGPWSLVSTHNVGGFTALGFDRTCEDMLVTSTSGQSILCGETGAEIYRNRDDDGLDTSALKGTRLDHPADRRVDMAGVYGGALRTVTDDGWSVDQVRGHGLLHPPDAPLHCRAEDVAGHIEDATFYLLARADDEIRVLGFSWTGRTLVVTTPNTLKIWGRPAPLTL